ncbi:MAG: hypothetical protein HY695_00825 [Deltaproteobacteria bacterium]|nr:hypothetical protein [Deltaproteobacteria bacterium]
MPKTLLAVLCDDVRIEQGNKFSLMGLFNQFQVRDFTQPLPPFHIFAQISFEQEGDYPLEIELRTIEGEKILQLKALAQARGVDEVRNAPVGTIIFKIGNLKIPRPGQYEFALICNDQVLQTVPFRALVPKQPFVQ